MILFKLVLWSNASTKGSLKKKEVLEMADVLCVVKDAGGLGAILPVAEQLLSEEIDVRFLAESGSVAWNELSGGNSPEEIRSRVIRGEVHTVFEHFFPRIVLSSMCGGLGPQFIAEGNERGIATATVECIFGERYEAYASSPPNQIFIGGDASFPLLQKAWAGKDGWVANLYGFPAFDGLVRSLAELDGDSICSRVLGPGRTLVHLSGGKNQVGRMFEAALENLDDDSLVFSWSIHPGAKAEEKPRASTVFRSFEQNRTLLPDDAVGFMDPFAMGHRCVMVAPVASSMLVQMAVAGGHPIAWAGVGEVQDLTAVTGIEDPRDFPPISAGHVALASDAESLQEALLQDLKPFHAEEDTVARITERISRLL